MKMPVKGVIAILSLLACPLSAVSQETQKGHQETQPVPAETQAAKNYPDMPEFQGIAQWFNSPPLTRASLKGKVVLVDFWTYTCINCLRTFSHLKDWYQKYKGQGLVIVGIHSPEFDFERDPVNVKMAIEKFKIAYPVALDNQMITWNAYSNQFWPAHYFIDARGRIRHTHFGEGGYEESERVIQDLLSEARGKKAETQPVSAAVPEEDLSQIQSPETYLGFLRRERLVTSGRPIGLNEWNLDGKWQAQGERIVLKEAPGKIRFRFNARKVHLVIHPGATPGKAVVRLDGQTVPSQKAGRDVHEGQLEINGPRLYELISLGPRGEEHTVEIEFLTPGTSVYAFTFG